MNIAWTLSTLVGFGLTAVKAESVPPDPAGKSVPAAADSPAVQALVAYFATNEIQLRHDKDGRWVVAEPKGDGYEVVVYLRTFPAGMTEKQMKTDLSRFNLAFLLHAPSRVAMSSPGLRGIDGGKKLPKLDQVPVVAKLKKLFNEYQVPEPKK
jgi:hypothetical protein